MNTTPAPTTNARRVLTQKESFQLLTWYTEHQERLLQVTDEGIVTEAGETLNIPGLNRAHLVSARKSLGIQKREQRKPAPPRNPPMWRHSRECSTSRQSRLLGLPAPGKAC